MWRLRTPKACCCIREKRRLTVVDGMLKEEMRRSNRLSKVNESQGHSASPALYYHTWLIVKEAHVSMMHCTFPVQGFCTTFHFLVIRTHIDIGRSKYQINDFSNLA